MIAQQAIAETLLAELQHSGFALTLGTVTISIGAGPEFYNLDGDSPTIRCRHGDEDGAKIFTIVLHKDGICYVDYAGNNMFGHRDFSYENPDDLTELIKTAKYRQHEYTASRTGTRT